MTWRLRAAGPADADALSLVATATFLETYAGVLAGADIVAHCRERLTPGAFAGVLAGKATDVALAEHEIGGAPIGYGVVVPSDLAFAAPGDAELLRLYALSSCHGTGLGRAMMTRAVEAARSAGADRLLVGTYWGNVRARRFYEHAGFMLVGERPFRVGAVEHRDPVYALAL